ncbi:MAG: Phage terminase large subunit [Firmicutes bacterium ADurb.Bin419]|nr:MAG: Phage terminase large subunit [Firmicutes bacterium ADurb.Bin419]
MIELPQFLNCPSKMLPLIVNFNDYRCFLCRGGRGGGKSHTIARFLLYLASLKKIRILCGRETQTSMKDSVHQLLGDIIKKYRLDFTIKGNEIIHNDTGSVFLFIGLREQGIDNVKSLEGVDICWIEEAQSLTTKSIDYLVPTIRKKNSKIILSGNPDTVDDAWLAKFTGRKDTLVININLDDNPFADEVLKLEAQICRERSEEDYQHIWLGVPQSSFGDYLYNFDYLRQAQDLEINRIDGYNNRIMGVDVAGAGEDSSVAVIIRQTSSIFWVVEHIEKWKESDTTNTIGRIISLISQYKPVATIQDICGIGKPIYDRIKEIGSLTNYVAFNGAEKPLNLDYVLNRRAESYVIFREYLSRNEIFINKNNIELLEDLRATRFKYAKDKIQILEKLEIRKSLGRSPDTADAFVMAVWGAMNYNHKEVTNIKVINNYNRRSR